MLTTDDPREAVALFGALFDSLPGERMAGMIQPRSGAAPVSYLEAVPCPVL